MAKKVVFVSGDFNILHPGHLRLLKFAKESGDYLIAGVTSNKRSRLENILDEQVRLESIRSTSYVDEALILEKDIESYLEEIKPCIVVKGKEYKYKKNQELGVLKKYGGKLIFTSGEIGFSSLELLKSEFKSYDHLSINHSTKYLDRHDISFSDLSKIVCDFNKLNILVIGDAIIDEYISCNPLGMSQEDPTIVVSPISNDKFIGGAAIVASHAKNLGANVDFITTSGDDDNFLYLDTKLKEIGVALSCYIDDTRPTSLKQRFRANGKTLLRVNHLKQHKIEKHIEDKIINKIKK